MAAPLISPSILSADFAQLGEEVRAIVKLRAATAAPDQFEVGLVDQGGGIQRMSMLLPCQLAAGHAMQFLVQRGQHAIQCISVAIAGGIQQHSDVTCNSHCGQQRAGEPPA